MPALVLWAGGLRAWTVAAAAAVEAGRWQVAAAAGFGATAVRLLGAGPARPVPDRARPLAERMAARSLRLVQGGRR
jgi:hypothetical protein